MFHNTKDQVLKQDILKKRATGRSKINTINYKERLFVLTPSSLSYYEPGSQEKPGKLKGSVDLVSIKAVERVDDYTLDGNKFCFQVLFDELILYIITSNDKQRREWVSILRDEVEAKNKCLLEAFHSGVYKNSHWSCCKDKTKNAIGCKQTYFAKSSNSSNTLPANLKKQISDAKVETQEYFKVFAKFDYLPRQKDDLPLEKGQEYSVLCNTEANWWKARDNIGREGYIPANYVSRMFGIESEVWYHPGMSRQEADVALKETDDGTFLVRNSSQQGMYTLSFCFQKCVKHYHIKLNSENKYYVSFRHRFESVSTLIEYHKLNCAGLVCRLKFPYIGNGTPPVTLGYGVFQINRTELCIQKQIGFGQFGTVHEALWKDQAKVAVKIMKPGTMSEHDFIEEAKIMQRFQHKNLVSIYGVCSLQSPLFIVVELMKEGSMLLYLRERQYLLKKIGQLTDMIFQVAAAMKYLEEEKFIHRDLAARNCLVGANNLIKVGDFGLARYVLDDQYTASEGTKFPVKWAAPEVIDYTKFSSKSDVWAFGVLCWETFSGGKSPYHHFSNSQVAEEVRRGYRLDKPPQCPTDIFDDLIMLCWAAAPEDRPSFRDIYQYLETLTEDYTPS